MLWIYGATVIRSRRRVSAPSCCGRNSDLGVLEHHQENFPTFMSIEIGLSRLIQNGPGWITQIKALHWQTPARGSFDHQRLFGALANRITLKTPMVSARNGNKRRQWAAMI